MLKRRHERFHFGCRIDEVLFATLACTMQIFSLLTEILIYAVPAVLAITLHEAAHGYAAKRLGDNTAWVLGRVTLNPMKHIDPVGTLLVPGLLLVGGMMTGGSALLFGWAKPVPVNFGRLYNPKRDMIWVALAGPLMNLAQVAAWLIVLKLIILISPESVLGSVAVDVAFAGLSVNMMLAAFNLIPILPLDGGRILEGLLPWKWAVPYSNLERYGMMIIVVLLVSGLLNYFISPFMHLLKVLVQWVAVF